MTSSSPSITPLAPVPAEALAKTVWIDLGKPGVDKEFRDFTWNGGRESRAPAIRSVTASTATAWLASEGDGGYDLPDGSRGKTIAVRVKMSSSHRGHDGTVRRHHRRVE